MGYYAATLWVCREMEKPLSITLGKKMPGKKVSLHYDPLQVENTYKEDQNEIGWQWQVS